MINDCVAAKQEDRTGREQNEIPSARVKKRDARWPRQVMQQHPWREGEENGEAVTDTGEDRHGGQPRPAPAQNQNAGERNHLERCHDPLLNWIQRIERNKMERRVARSAQPISDLPNSPVTAVSKNPMDNQCRILSERTDPNRQQQAGGGDKEPQTLPPTQPLKKKKRAEKQRPHI